MAKRHRLASGLVGVAIVTGLVGCRTDESNEYRGRGLKVATLSPADQAAAYHAALRPVFEMDDPQLSLLLDPRLLPRSAGIGEGPPIPPSVANALRERGTVKGTCQAPHEATRKTLLCQAPLPGYVVRFSDVLQLAPDSVQVYVLIQKYDTPTSGASESLRFERVYQVVRHDGAWRAVREGRMPSLKP